MSDENETFNDNNTSENVFDDVISNNIRFWIYLIFLIPSIICSLSFICYTLFNRNVRMAPHNHAIAIVILIGLIYQVTIYPWMLYYYHHEGIWHRSLIFCTIWSFIDWGLYFVQTIVFAWATIERHILIFHEKWLSNRTKRFFLHYLPLLIILIYTLIFYILLSFFPSCQNSFNDRYMICVTFCFTQTHILYMWDAIVHQTLPNLIIVLFSIALLARVLYQKHRIHRSIQWRKHRKMTVQLLSISILYFLFAFPLTLMNLMYLCGLSGNIGDNLYEYLLFFNYLMLLFLPFACVLSLPEFLLKIKYVLHFRRHLRIVAPKI